MSTITSLTGSDGITTANSMTKINANFANLNSDKIETSTLDTDTTLAANSDSKIATQKAVKAYVDSGGNVNASETNKGIVEEATDAEVTAGTATGATGAKLFVTPAKLNTLLSTGPIVRTYTAAATLGSTTTRFDISNPAGSTFRYTYDGTGTDPVINSTTFPVGAAVQISAFSFSPGNIGSFIVTGSGTNYFEVTNASGVAEVDKTLGTGGFLCSGQTWTKPTGLKYIIAEVVGGGGSAAKGVDAGASGYGGGGAGAGGYSRKLIAAASLGTTESLQPAKASPVRDEGLKATGSIFGAHLSATGGNGGGTSPGGVAASVLAGAGGVGSGGDINIRGGDGNPGVLSISGQDSAGGAGGSSVLGGGGLGAGTTSVTGGDGGNYGGGGGGGSGSSSGSSAGGAGSSGIVIVTEYYI